MPAPLGNQSTRQSQAHHSAHEQTVIRPGRPPSARTRESGGPAYRRFVR